ncbi:hypothetical protein PG985_015174 [Apiospora marii]|uniref:Secreted protein n=1 Tax=Apiospora marii TaxID=335849 RepID=A0ABR1S8K1_9PEZI
MKASESRPIPALLFSALLFSPGSFLAGLAWLAGTECEFATFFFLFLFPFPFLFTSNLSLVLMGHGIPVSPTCRESADLLFERRYVQSSVTRDVRFVCSVR